MVFSLVQSHRLWVILMRSSWAGQSGLPQDRPRSKPQFIPLNHNFILGRAFSDQPGHCLFLSSQLRLCLQRSFPSSQKQLVAGIGPRGVPRSPAGGAGPARGFSSPSSQGPVSGLQAPGAPGPREEPETPGVGKEPGEGARADTKSFLFKFV